MYNPGGIRTSAHFWTEVSGVSQNDDKTTLYIVDPGNPTGYVQVLEEWAYDLADPVFGTSTPSRVRYYTLGDDVIAQTDDTAAAGEATYLLYDGHGSTRQLMDGSLNVIDAYNYDGYGVMLGGNPTPSTPAQTNLLYSGEQFAILVLASC